MFKIRHDYLKFYTNIYINFSTEKLKFLHRLLLLLIMKFKYTCTIVQWIKRNIMQIHKMLLINELFVKCE